MNFFSNQVKTIYFNTFQKEIRNKSIVFLFILTTIIIFMINALFGFFSELMGGIGDTEGMVDMAQMGGLSKLPLNMFYMFIDSWSLLVACALGVSIVQSDTDNNVMIQLLSFPVRRWEYLLARILGGWTIVIIYYFYSIGLAQFLFYNSSKEFLIGGNTIYAIINSCLILLPALLLAVFYTLYSPKMIAFILSFLSTFIVSWANYSMVNRSLSDVMGEGGVLNYFYGLIHYALPRIGTLNSFTSGILQGKEFNTGLYSVTFFHYIGTVVLFFILLSFIFKRKDY